MLETTALGAAYLAGLGEGVWASRDEVASHWKLDREFLSAPEGDAERRYVRWKKAVERARAWAEG